MMLSIGKLLRLGLFGDEADQSLARLEVRAVDRFDVQALGGHEFERAVAPPQIERAHLRHDVGRDQHHDLVEASLGAHVLGHHLTEAPEHLSWSTN